jgi:hypothetical protein
MSRTNARPRHFDATWRKYLPAGMVIIALILALGGLMTSCGAPCSAVLAIRDADPEWQSGSLPAVGTAFVGNQVADMAANAWLGSVDDTIRSIVQNVPVIGPALTSLGELSITVDRTSFSDVRDGSGATIIFDLVLSAAPSSHAGRIGIPGADQLRQLTQVSARLRVQAPIQIDSSIPERSIVIANLDGVRLSAVDLNLGPLRAGFDPSLLLDPIQERLLRGQRIDLAEITPLEVSSVQLQMRALRVRYSSDTHLAIDVEFPEVAAPAGSDGVPSLTGLPSDALVLALSEPSALALGDYGLRIVGSNGFNRNGERGGPYATRLRTLSVDGEQITIEMDALRCRRPCATARIQTVFHTMDSEDQFRISVEQTSVVQSSVPSMLVAAALPSSTVLSERATAMTREVLMSRPVQIPLLPTHEIVVEEIGAQGNVIVGIARLQPITPSTPRVRR